MIYEERLKGIRKNRKETQADTAQVIGIDQRQYSRYENGKNELPIRYLIELCKHWDVSADYILGLTDEERSYK